MRIGVLASHPIQYHAPLYRRLAERLDLHVYYGHRQTPNEQAAAGFGVAFDWDVDLLGGYSHTFLRNRARRLDVGRFSGCSTPDIAGSIARGGFDAFVVTGWNLRCYWQAVLACKRAGVPVLVRGDSQLHTPRSALKQLAKEVLYRPMLRLFDGFLVVGKRNNEYLRHYGVPEVRLFPAPHFVDNPAFAAAAAAAKKEREALRASFGGPDHAPVFLFVGKLIPEKRPADLLRAAALLNGARAVYVGAGALEGALREEAARLGVPTFFAGFRNQTELPAYYAAADALVLPSESETWGLVVNEALACGTPVVVSNAVGCAPDLVEEGRTGSVFAVGDVQALAVALTRALDVACRPDFARVVAEKMARYSVEAAADGVLLAVGTLRRLPVPTLDPNAA